MTPPRSHGYGPYTRGCRCQVCKKAKRDYVRARRAAGTMPDPRTRHDVPNPPRHGDSWAAVPRSPRALKAPALAALVAVRKGQDR